jgi:uncharacterized SAM-binding protein YcdF (DUF218 family)
VPSEDGNSSCDLLFVLAGAKSRKLFAIDEYDRQLASRLLLSTGRFELRKFEQLPICPKPDLVKLAASIPPPERHCFVLYSNGKYQITWIKVGRFGTLSEIEALAQWLDDRPDVKSILMLSSQYHLRRVALCCRFLLPQSVRVKFVGVPGEAISFRERIREWLKMLSYAFIVRFTRKNHVQGR